MSGGRLENLTGVDLVEKVQATGDDRSSSLSELGDPGGIERSSRADSEANDTEAETERLEDSPQKQRRQRDVVLTSTNGAYTDHQDQPVADAVPANSVSLGPGSEAEKLEQTSDISSLEDSGEESGKDSSPLSIPSSKRKRSSFEEDSAKDGDVMREPSSKAMKFTDDGTAEPSAKFDTRIPIGVSAANRDLPVLGDTATSPSNEEHRTKSQSLPRPKHRKGKRKSKRVSNDEPSNTGNAGSGAESTAELGRSAEAMYSNEEDAQTENMAEGVEAENPLKMEELVGKKSAMDSLGAIERWFAKLRDKIYEERIAQCNQELAVLEQSAPIHPELLAMKEVIDRRRDQKVEYENDLMRFKLMTLQRESVANKAQAHSQYLQTIREVRDSYLESLNQRCYQVQRERRSCEGDVPDCMYTFTTKRSQQITHQMAYNTEVSILAGVAKHVGFPAAPKIGNARSKEIDDDFRSMGIAAGAAQNAQNHHTALRAGLSTTATFPRQRPGAEEHFLEQTPWANPQHPAHHQQRNHRQVSGLSGAATRSSTPAGQTRLVNLAEPQGSASSIVEPPSGPGSSMVLTSAAGEASKRVQPGRRSEMSENIAGSISSRVVNGGLPDSTPAKADRQNSPALRMNVSIDRQTPSVLPKPLPFMHTGGASGFRTPTPVRYPLIKAEDANVVSRHSPVPHQFHGTAPVSTASDGRANRFAA